mgnify:CR=1 FL=1
MSRRTTPDVLNCFDADLRIRRHQFADAVCVCDVAVQGPPVIPDETPASLLFGDHVVDLSVVLDWLPTLAEGDGWAYYVHHHDNLVVELARIEPYDQTAFRRSLRLFRTRPASEGGANLLGVVDSRRAWVLVIENDNQGGFRVGFFGPTEVCQSLRSCLGQQRQAEPGAAADGGACKLFGTCSSRGPRRC